MKKGKRLTSAYDEHEVRERLRKTTPTVKESLKVQEARKWVGLTGDEIDDLPKGGTLWEIIRAAEAILREKNGG